MDVKKEISSVLYLSYDGLTDPLGQSQILPYLTGLSTAGFDMTIISFEKKARFTVDKKNIEAICEAYNIKWFPLFYTKSPPVLSTLKDLNTLKRKIGSLQKKTPFSLVHCRSYITALAGLWMKKKWNVKFLFDMRGFWVDERVEGGLWKLSNPLYKIIYQYFKKKEKKFLESADHIISLTENGKNEIHSWKHITGQPVSVTVIPCCVDLDLFDPGKVNEANVNELKQKLGIDSSATIISYIGSVGTWYMLDEMLDFFKRWLLKNPQSIFLFVTKDEKEKIMGAAKKAGINEKAVRIQQASRHDVPLMIMASDYSIFFIKPVFSKKASSPTKQGEIMAMNKPVICNSGVGDTDIIINKYQSGILIEQFTDEAYDKAIYQLESKKFDSENIRKGASEIFSLKEGIRRYAEVYTKTLNAEAN